MKQELFKKLTSDGLIGKVNLLPSGRWLTKYVSGQRILETIRYLNREFRKVPDSNIKLVRQVQSKNGQVAEAIAVDIPNGESYVSFGSGKFILQLIQAYWISEFYPELLTRLLVDNKDFTKMVDQEIKSFKKTSQEIQESDYLCKIIYCLAARGPRTLAGYKTLDFGLDRLRISYHYPKKPTKAQFRRGYNDKGSKAPDPVSKRRMSEMEINDLISTIGEGIKATDPRFQYHVKYDDDMKMIRINVKPLTQGLSVSELSDKQRNRLQKYSDYLAQIVLQNYLSVQETVKQINQVLRRG